MGVVGDLGWYASVGSAGFPPSRERREGRGNDRRGAGERQEGVREQREGSGWGLLATLVGMRVLVALGSRLRGNDRRGAGTTGGRERGGGGREIGVGVVGDLGG